MLRSKSKDDLKTWIDRATRSLVASFANGIIRDRAAVQNAITSMWSNGQTEGQITKLKLKKRQMYGRGKLDCSRHVLSERPNVIEIASEPRLDADHPMCGVLIPCLITNQEYLCQLGVGLMRSGGVSP